MTLGKLAHPLLRLTMLLHGKIPACHIAAHRLHVLGVALCRRPRRSWLRLLLLVGGSDLVWYLDGPRAPHGATVHKRLPMPFALHAGVDSHLTAAAASVWHLGDRRGVELRVRRCQPIPRGAAHHSARLIHQMHLLFVLIIVIKMGQLGLILIGGRMMKGWLQGGEALFHGYLLTHGVHWVFRVATFPKAFEALAEYIPILAKKTHHSWIRHLLPTHGSCKHTSGACLCFLTEGLVLNAYNP